MAPTTSPWESPRRGGFSSRSTAWACRSARRCSTRSCSVHRGSGELVGIGARTNRVPAAPGCPAAVMSVGFRTTPTATSSRPSTPLSPRPGPQLSGIDQNGQPAWSAPRKHSTHIILRAAARRQLQGGHAQEAAFSSGRRTCRRYSSSTPATGNSDKDPRQELVLRSISEAAARASRHQGFMLRAT